MRLTSLLALLVWGSVLGLLGYFFYDMNTRRQAEHALRESIARLSEEKPCARIMVDAVEDDRETGQTVIHMRWLDTDASWTPRPGARMKNLKVVGREAYFDTYQIVFDRDRIQEGDPLRGRTLTLFSKVYGSDQKPSEGQPLDMPGSVAGIDSGLPSDVVPVAYRTSPEPPSDLETRLWSRFWDLCLDPDAAKEEGVRTVQGTAVHKPMVAGMEYRLSINNQGQIFFDGPMRPDPFIEP
jgi:hypothetical protein